MQRPSSSVITENENAVKLLLSRRSNLQVSEDKKPTTDLNILLIFRITQNRKQFYWQQVILLMVPCRYNGFQNKTNVDYSRKLIEWNS